jgi:two-component system response regulator GlrR
MTVQTDAVRPPGSGYRVLLVDDDPEIHTLVSVWLERAGYRVDSARSGSDARARIEVTRPDVIITDLKMDGMSGIDLLAEVHRDNPLLPVILLSGQAQIPDAVRATHMGSSAFLVKPAREEDVLAAVQRALRLGGEQEKARRVFSDLLTYRSPRMAQLVELAGLVAETDVTVLVSGATGTGKEVIARAIHLAGPRRDRPFIAVNCGAIPEQLLESELFGHEKGAFTGAHVRHEGLFKAADGGTLFLDEIGDMPLALQAKLLRVLQDFTVRPVGSVKNYPVNVRIISATHRDLEQMVREREFREDLYYRLRVVPLAMPALADRREDIPLLVARFLDQFAQRNNGSARHFSPEALEILMAAPWPGNIRQLNNVVDMCATLCKTANIPASMVRSALQDRPAELQTLKEAKHAFERNYLITVLRLTHGHVANAARIAGRNRTEFYKLLAMHGIEPTAFRAENGRKAP